MPFAAAMSEHPLTAHAVGEVTGAVLEQHRRTARLRHRVRDASPRRRARRRHAHRRGGAPSPGVAGVRGGVGPRTAPRGGAGRGRHLVRGARRPPRAPRARRPAVGHRATAWSCGAGPPRSPSPPRRSSSWATPTASRPSRSSPGWTPTTPACGWSGAWPRRHGARAATASPSAPGSAPAAPWGRSSGPAPRSPPWCPRDAGPSATPWW